MVKRSETPGELDPIEFLRNALAISPDDAAQVRESKPGSAGTTSPCERARARLCAAEQALKPFTATNEADWDDETRAAFHAAVRERDTAEMQVAELCGQEGPSAAYGDD